jgi:hypothetical protein
VIEQSCVACLERCSHNLGQPFERSRRNEIPAHSRLADRPRRFDTGDGQERYDQYGKWRTKFSANIARGVRG